MLERHCAGRWTDDTPQDSMAGKQKTCSTEKAAAGCATFAGWRQALSLCAFPLLQVSLCCCCSYVSPACCMCVMHVHGGCMEAFHSLRDFVQNVLQASSSPQVLPFRPCVSCNKYIPRLVCPGFSHNPQTSNMSESKELFHLACPHSYSRSDDPNQGK